MRIVFSLSSKIFTRRPTGFTFYVPQVFKEHDVASRIPTDNIIVAIAVPIESKWRR